MKSQALALITCFIICASHIALARSPATNTNHPIERFTRSLSALYVALASCSFISPHRNASPVSRIQQYMTGLYPEGIPYWALPKIKTQIDDEDICNFLIYDRIITYRQARNDFRKVYPYKVPPPDFVASKPRVSYTITEDFLKFGTENNLDVVTMKRSLSLEY